MKNNENIQTNHKQGAKPYSPIQLTVYGKMIKLTASGSTTAGENNGGGLAGCLTSGRGNKC